MSEGPALSAFLGQWTVTRRIEDRLARQVARFQGRADFVPHGDSVAYREAGTLTLTDAQLQAERSYGWRDTDGGIEVSFDDGRPFHIIGPGLRPEAHHDCAPDAYDVAYDFGTWPRWRATWTVVGPRKDYTMVSDYLPAT